MQVATGSSARWGRGEHAPRHLVVAIAERRVLACTGGAAAKVELVESDVVRDELTCNPCRQFWSRARDVPRATGDLRSGSG